MLARDATVSSSSRLSCGHNVFGSPDFITSFNLFEKPIHATSETHTSIDGLEEESDSTMMSPLGSTMMSPVGWHECLVPQVEPALKKEHFQDCAQGELLLTYTEVVGLRTRLCGAVVGEFLVTLVASGDSSLSPKRRRASEAEAFRPACRKRPISSRCHSVAVLRGVRPGSAKGAWTRGRSTLTPLSRARHAAPVAMLQPCNSFASANVLEAVWERETTEVNHHAEVNYHAEKTADMIRGQSSCGEDRRSGSREIAEVDHHAEETADVLREVCGSKSPLCRDVMPCPLTPSSSPGLDPLCEVAPQPVAVPLEMCSPSFLSTSTPFALLSVDMPCEAHSTVFTESTFQSARNTNSEAVTHGHCGIVSNSVDRLGMDKSIESASLPLVVSSVAPLARLRPSNARAAGHVGSLFSPRAVGGASLLRRKSASGSSPHPCGFARCTTVHTDSKSSGIINKDVVSFDTSSSASVLPDLCHDQGPHILSSEVHCVESTSVKACGDAAATVDCLTHFRAPAKRELFDSLQGSCSASISDSLMVLIDVKEEDSDDESKSH